MRSPDRCDCPWTASLSDECPLHALGALPPQFRRDVGDIDVLPTGSWALGTVMAADDSPLAMSGAPVFGVPADVMERWLDGEAVRPMRYFVEFLVNRELVSHVHFQVMHDSHDLALVPDSLLAAV